MELVVPKPRLLRRRYGNYHQPSLRIPLLSPTLWSVAACATIYLGCAGYDVYRASLRAKAKEPRWPSSRQDPTFEDLEYSHENEKANTMWSNIDSERPEFVGVDRLLLGTLALAAGAHAASRVIPSASSFFVHTPLLSPNYTLLSSVFGHSGLLHLGVNMYAMVQLMPLAARTDTFGGSPAHLAAFFLSTGILSSLAQHATAIWPRPNPLAMSLGASGALFALLGVAGVSFPDMQIGILLVPGSLPVGKAMACAALFDGIGILVKYPFFNLAHGSHLSGLLLGVAYASYGGNERIWRPGRKLAFKAMRYAGML